MSMYDGIDFSKVRKKQEKKPLFTFTPALRKKLLIALAVAAGLGLVVYGSAKTVSWIKRHPSKPAENAKPQQVAKFIVSDSFNKLSLAEKEEYLRKLRGSGGPPPGSMPDSGMRPPPMMGAPNSGDRQALMEKMMEVREARERKTAKEYFALPKEQREAWMARRMAEREKMRAEMRARFGQGGQRGAQGGTASSARPPGGGPGGGPDGGGGPPPF